MEPFTLIAIFSAGLIGGGIAGFASARLFAARTIVARSDYEKARRENAALEAKCDSLVQQLDAAKRDAGILSDTLADLRGKSAAQEERLAQMNSMQEQNRATFEQMAAAVLEKNSQKFQEHSQKSLLEMLNPLRERFGEFQKKVDESFGTQAKEQFALKEEIKRIVEVNEKMTLQTDSLTKALKGDVKAQGNWGEIMLEKILEDSGLRKGVDYLVQSAGMGLKAEDGSVQRPDVVVNLPEGKHVIVDSKVSLTHYERYCGEADDAARAMHLRQYLDSLRAHVAGLAQRRYQDNPQLGTPDFVLMFLPIEGAYSLAVQQDSGLHGSAWDKKVVVVCPTTLFATLQTIASMWKIELRNQNAQDIAVAAGRLYDKVHGFVENMREMGKQLDKARESFDAGMNKLSDGRGNILRQTEQLRLMGAKTSKILPKELLGGEEDELPALELVS